MHSAGPTGRLPVAGSDDRRARRPGGARRPSRSGRKIEFVTIVRVAFFPGGTEEHYRRLAEVMGDRIPPAGRLAFACGPVPGGWQVVQVWQSRAALDAFNSAHLFPAFRRLGAGGFPEPPQAVDFEPVDLQLGG